MRCRPGLLAVGPCAASPTCPTSSINPCPRATGSAVCCQLAGRPRSLSQGVRCLQPPTQPTAVTGIPTSASPRVPWHCDHPLETSPLGGTRAGAKPLSQEGGCPWGVRAALGPCRCCSGLERLKGLGVAGISCPLPSFRRCSVAGRTDGHMVLGQCAGSVCQARPGGLRLGVQRQSRKASALGIYRGGGYRGTAGLHGDQEGERSCFQSPSSPPGSAG